MQPFTIQRNGRTSRATGSSHFARRNTAYGGRTSLVVLGVTGSIGCGKTYACKKLAQFANFPVRHINVDDVRRDILGTNPAHKETRQALCDCLQVAAPDGSIDTAKLNQRIYNDANAMQWYKHCMQPAINHTLEKAVEHNDGLTLVEWALLAEDGMLPLVGNKVLLVQCSAERQLERLASGDLPIDQVQKRITQQLSNQEKEREIQRHKSRLYKFDTTFNPKAADYASLLRMLMHDFRIEDDLRQPAGCLFRLPTQGMRVLWEITAQCNYACPYCIFSCEKRKQGDELDTQTALQTLDDLKRHGVTHIKYTGGEPFVRKDMLQILMASLDYGFKVDISTNASLITPTIAKELGKEGIVVHVSVDGDTKEVQEAARGAGTYEPTVRGLRHLVDNDVYVRIGTAIFKGNQDRLERMVDFAASRGACEIIFSFMEPTGRLNGDRTMISDMPASSVQAILDHLKQDYVDRVAVNYSFAQKGTNSACPGARQFLFIDNLGRVSPCTWVVDKHPHYRTESLGKQTFHELTNSMPIRAYLAYITSLECQGHKGCPMTQRDD